ncbi:phospholipase D-like protein [Chitinophaga dinghuensis]|uniref:phospholipase D n=1 Tax=Chitinophaga dinghuensis TaxID=1539050 RepID=A0A327W3C2_9BACT|nr:phospholipase D-like domain-containing protein [Chitinophaga dinghuensis]RAJ83153.1 phospholipase D-like protein [Chitinophaga dinghuensis]
MELIDQHVINDNKEIFAKIQHELHHASSEILLATGWFTDEDLFNILSEKLDQGISIEIIIADNQDNEKLDFNQLAVKGANVYKIRMNGYGVMNQKFCVIDKRIALHGSYNWTVNAKKNNHESIISTNHRETIDTLIKNFNEIKEKINEQKEDHAPDNVATTVVPQQPIKVLERPPLKVETEFENVLDSMIAAEVKSFDRKLLREHGFERCSANNGDHQVLYKAFDTLYSVFINEIDAIDDKKRRLIAKIEEFKAISQSKLEKEHELTVNFLEQESSDSKANLEVKGIRLSAEISSATQSIKEIKESKIPYSEKENAVLDKQIKVAEQESVRPKFKWFEFIPVVFFNIALFSYSLIFYSSAAYILLFGVEDAKLQQAQNIPTAPAQVFNPEALSLAMNKTGTAAIFIFLFVCIPLAFASVDHFVKPQHKKLVAILGFVFGILVLDGAIAYKVAQAVHEMNYAQGNVNVPWSANMVLSDTNFYLVFVFGAFGLVLFKLAFKKLINIFEERNPDIIAQRNQLRIKHLSEEMILNSGKIMQLEASMMLIEKDILQLKAGVQQTDIELRELPVRLNQELQKKRVQLLRDVESIDRIAAIYTMHIQSDNLPISIDALKDRINVFLEGWNDFLHKEYAIAKATNKTTQAAEVAARWQQENIHVRKIDKRVKIPQDV